MSERSAEDAMLDRANLDARIAFVAAGFALAYAFVALLDRVGAPERFIGGAAPYFTILALAVLGFLLHSMRVSQYYTAGRAVPACYAGFANAAIVLGLLLPFASRLAGQSWGLGVVCGLFLGLAGAAFASQNLTEESAERQRGAVQVGDPFMEKLVCEACLELLATGAVAGIQDMGAAGLTCSTCETAARAGTG